MITNVVLWAVILVFVLLLLTGGPLLPVWMLFNSLQLLVHLPLIPANMPALANLYLTNLLNSIRLFHDGFSNRILGADSIRESDWADYQATIDDE